MTSSPHLNRCLMTSWSWVTKIELALLLPQNDSADRTSVAMKLTGHCLWDTPELCRARVNPSFCPLPILRCAHFQNIKMQTLLSLVGWLVIEVEQLFTVLEQWRTAVPKIDWALSRSNHTKCYPSMWLIFVIISDILSLLSSWTANRYVIYV